MLNEKNSMNLDQDKIKLYNRKIEYYMNQNNTAKLNKYLQKGGGINCEITKTRFKQPKPYKSYIKYSIEIPITDEYIKKLSVNTENATIQTYDISNIISVGSGAAGTVYKGDLIINNYKIIVAIKEFFLESEARKEYVRINTIHLSEDGIIKYQLGDYINNCPLMFCDIDSKILIYKYCGETGKNKLNKLISIFKQLIIKFRELNRNNICHNDVKYENIVIDDDNNVNIVDFGLSKTYSDLHLGYGSFFNNHRDGAVYLLTTFMSYSSEHNALNIKFLKEVIPFIIFRKTIRFFAYKHTIFRRTLLFYFTWTFITISCCFTYYVRYYLLIILSIIF